jgi:prepilin-type N-terminal cleavage/methylation domain-containing protein
MIHRNVMSPATESKRASRRGFTLTELMAVIAIIAVLVGIVLASMRSLRHAGLQTAQLNDLRQIAVAYRSYSDENDARLLPGYIGEDLLAPGQIFGNLTVKSVSGVTLQDGDVQAYVWRLAPYMSENWATFYAGLRDSGVTEKLQGEYRNDVFGPESVSFAPGDIGISERPAYGINAIFLGGDSVHGGDYAVARNPWTPTPGLENEILAATRMAQVKNPAKIIVAAPTAKAQNTGDPTDVYDVAMIGSGISNERVGHCELRPPYTELNDPAGTEWVEAGRWWRVGRGGEVRRIAAQSAYGSSPDGTGLPVHRVKAGFLPVVMVDGSTSVESTAELSRDMTRWCPSEVARRPTEPAGLDPMD